VAALCLGGASGDAVSSSTRSSALHTAAQANAPPAVIAALLRPKRLYEGLRGNSDAAADAGAERISADTALFGCGADPELLMNNDTTALYLASDGGFLQVSLEDKAFILCVSPAPAAPAPGVSKGPREAQHQSRPTSYIRPRVSMLSQVPRVTLRVFRCCASACCGCGWVCQVVEALLSHGAKADGAMPSEEWQGSRGLIAKGGDVLGRVAGYLSKISHEHALATHTLAQLVRVAYDKRLQCDVSARKHYHSAPGLFSPLVRLRSGHGGGDPDDWLASLGDVLNSEPANGATPLHAACERGFPLVAAALLAAGASPEDRSMRGVGPLHSVAMHGHGMTCTAILGPRWIGATSAPIRGGSRTLLLHTPGDVTSWGCAGGG